MKLLQALRNAAQRLEADFDDSQLFEHKGDRGEFRENIIHNFLRPFLQTCYGLGSGAVFAQNGQSSRQIDIIIYDTVFSNVLFREMTTSLFPCESVYGTVEVKSSLNSEHLGISVENVASVKRLPRDASDMLDVTPLRRLPIGSGLTYDRSPRNPYLGVVFAYDGLTMETLMAQLDTYLKSDEYSITDMPDFLFCLKRGYTVIRATQSNEKGISPAPLNVPADGYLAFQSGNDTLPLFYLTLNVCLNQIHLRSANLNDYWLAIFREVFGATPESLKNPDYTVILAPEE
jgi:hypothetical protein